MGSLLEDGYRSPQFSEDSAWLPCWLQHQNVQPLHDERDSGYRFTNKCTREDAILSLDGEGRYKNCHLFLSGEDMLFPSLCQSSANVGGFHLHLSSNGVTQDFYSSELGTFKAQNKASYNISLVHETELIASQKVKGTSSLKHACPSLKGNIDMRTKNQENVRRNDDCDAVELSNAAAEALIIHDLAKSSSYTKGLSSAAILEVALRVKQARLEGINDISYCSGDDIDEDESMLDFGESDMEDAFEDVGLIFCDSDDISQVKETPNLETHSVKDFPVNTFNEQEPVDIINTDNRERKGVLVEIIGFDGEQKVEDDPTSDLTIYENVPRNDIGLPSLMVEKNDVPVATVGLYLALKNITQPLKNAKQTCSLQTEGSLTGERDDKLHYSGPDKFQSRWLGGWMRKKEKKASMTTAHKNLNTVPRLLTGETSYVSESADIAPDKNSHIHIHDEGSHMASQPSIQFKDLHDKADESKIFSPNTQIPSCLSLADPLCSFVPCSLLSENTCHSKDNDLNIVEDTEEFSRPAMENCNDNLERSSTSNTEFVFGEQTHVPKINGEASYGSVCRHLTSLSKYSTISPNNSRLISTENNLYAREFEESHETEIQASLEKDRSSPLSLNRRKRFLARKEVDFIDREKNSENTSRPECDIALRKSDSQKDHLKGEVAHNPEKRPRKRVRFSGTLQKTDIHKQSSHVDCSGAGAGAGKGVKGSHTKRAKKSQNPRKNADGLVLRNLEFLLTGFPLQKERKIKNIIKKHDGKVLHRIPFSNSRGRMISKSSVQYNLVVLCPHKLETTEFLYGCVVNAFILRVDWLTDSVKAGSALATDKYMVIPNRSGGRNVQRPLCRIKHDCLFNGVGIMLHGKHSYCNRLATVIKHGDGKVFKTLQLMVQNLGTNKISHGIIVAEDERAVSRHLKQCASEGKIHTMAASWIINSLHLGKLLPFNANKHSPCLPKIRILDFPEFEAFSEEI